MPYQLGIIGAGFITQTAILPAIKQADDWRVAAVLDRDADRLAELAKDDAVSSTTDDEDAFFQQEMDAVYIATPNAMHAPLSIRALERGLAVLVEKPFAESPASGRAMLEAERNADRPAMIGYMSKFHELHQTVMRLLAGGELGPLVSMNGVCSFPCYNEDAWRQKKQHSGYGALADLGIYPLLTSIDLFGDEPVSCSATAYPADDPELANAFLTGALNFPGDRTLHLTTSFDSSGVHYTLLCGSGMVRAETAWDVGGGGELWTRSATGQTNYPITKASPYVQELRCLKEALDGQPIPEFVSFNRGYRDLLIMDTLTQSATRHGTELTIDYDR